MTAPATPDLREALAIWLMAIDECIGGDTPADYLEHETAFLHRNKGAVHDGDCTKKSHSCARCICETYLKAADTLLSGPLAPILTRLAEAEKGWEETRHNYEAMLRLFEANPNALWSQARTARAEVATLQGEVAGLRDELAAWKRVAVIAAVPFESMRASGSYQALSPEIVEYVDLAVVTTRMAITDGLLPPSGSYDAGTEPARAALKPREAGHGG